jgi:hypothetical protein
MSLKFRCGGGSLEVRYNSVCTEFDQVKRHSNLPSSLLRKLCLSARITGEILLLGLKIRNWAEILTYVSCFQCSWIPTSSETDSLRRLQILYKTLSKFYIRSLCCRVYVEKFKVTQLVKEFPASMKPKGSLLCLQKPVIRPQLSQLTTVNPTAEASPAKCCIKSWSSGLWHHVVMW